MKKITCFILYLTATALFSLAQPSAANVDTPRNQVAGKSPSELTRHADNNAPQLTKFDLDFNGGTPQELIDAIGAAKGRPVNSVIPSSARDERLPAFKVKRVDVAELFSAMLQASVGYRSIKRASEPLGSVYNTSAGFQTLGKPTDDSVWYFRVESGVAPQAQNVCRFYLLTPYLDAGLSVDDISTAIQTGWKMFEDGEVPHISFHKETKLLIAVGPVDKVQMIDDVLRVLTPPPKIVTIPEKH